MFDSSNRTPRRGGYRQDENPRERNGAHYSADGASARPRFNPNASAQDGAPRRRQRIQRPAAGATRFEKVEARPSFRSNNGEQASFNNGERQFRPRPKHNADVYSNRKRQEYAKNYEDPTKPIRLNKYLANAGICSRREADDFIQAGVITVNGEVVDNLGAKVLPTDKVMFHEQPVRRERKVYILLNKPKNTVTTTDDPQERHTVLDIVRNACAERIYPVGRLDRNTTGVLLLTNDGDLAAKLTHPKFGKKKIYAVTLDRDFEEADEAILRAGVILDDEKIVPDALEFPQEDRKHIGLEIHSGQNRVVRRMFEKVGYKVTKLDRVSFAGLTKKNVARGKYRFLTPKEVAMLQMGAFE
jgi:23S rRNA pseudouridine2605 synthase